ncbi:MAG: hypothetical protein HIU92_07480 [Proteobacteria bacterium]|nr:hypothetical protein [Pseudomonadota bacterium]
MHHRLSPYQAALPTEVQTMDVRTIIMLTPPAIFVVAGLIWFWTNEL